MIVGHEKIKTILLVGLYVFLISFAAESLWVLVHLDILLPLLVVSLSYALLAIGGCFLLDSIQLLVKGFKK